MKRFLALLLTLSLLLACSAVAEGATYLRELPQYVYINTTLLTEESYPEVCISPYYSFRFFGSYAVDPLFLCFPGPDSASPESFDSSSAAYLDVENKIQYSYVLDESNSFEEFINKAEKDEWILADGSDGTAAVIFPERGTARGMIATREFGKSSKLRISISLDQLSSRQPEETRVSALTDAILAEVERVKNAMHYETRAPYWSVGKYAGAKLISYDDPDYMLKLDFPTLTCQTDKGDVQADMILSGVQYSKTIRGNYFFTEDTYLDVELEFSDYSYAAHMLEDNDEHAAEVTASDGRKWILWLNWYDDTRAISGYASTLLDYGQNHDEERYLTVSLSGAGGNIEWNSNESFMQYVEQFTFTEMKAADDPYVPAEKVEPAEAPAAAEESKQMEEGGAGKEEAPAEEDTWTCPECGETNTGKFCPECGTPKPEAEPEEWTCPGCGSVNTGKFCPECGSPRPD